MNEVLAYAQQNREAYLQELFELLAIPSISTEPKHEADLLLAADWLLNKMSAAGLENVRTYDMGGHPLIYGDWLNAGSSAPTLLVYGHYDVQPPEPLDLWHSPPFEPVVRDDFLYARGASDDKGQLYVHIKAVEAYLQANGRLPLNVKFILEGEEESGGESLSAFIPANKELLAADAVVISDTAMLNRKQPAISYGLRGNIYTFLDVTGPDHDLHSGGYGGGINNPLNAIAHIIAQLKDENGRILIPGFYDRVRPLSSLEKKLMEEVPFDEEAWLEGTGAPAVWGEPDFTLPERLGVRPTLDVNGIIGGYTGSGRKTVLPSTVHAKISMRIVPDQDPHEIAALYRDYIAKIAPESVEAKVTICSASAPSVSRLDSPAMDAASAAFEKVFGRAPVFLRSGGSIPVVGEFQSILGLESVLMGFGLPDDRIHSPNERFYVPNFYQGIETSIHFIDQFATRSMAKGFNDR